MTLSTQLLTTLTTLIYRPLLRRSAMQILQGRLLDPEAPEAGRWLQDDVQTYLDRVWEEVDRLLPAAQLDTLPTVGNRHNVFLAVMTTAAYRELVRGGTDREYAMVLLGDVGWKVYGWLLQAAALPFKVLRSDRQAQLDGTLDALMVFPFNAPGAPGYEVEAWTDDEGYHTHWTHCPPHTFVRRLTEEQGDDGELDAFYRSWCLYDWAGADVLVGDGEHGHYERPQTLSLGDPVYDMCWHARVRRAAQRAQEAPEPRIAPQTEVARGSR